MPTIKIHQDTKKPTRTEALQLLKKLRGHVSDAHLEALFLHFTAPPARRPAKSAAEWVARAVAVRDVRAYLCYMWVSPEGVAYGTDGHRAHISSETGLAPGYYCPKTLAPVDVSGKYPDVERLIPKLAPDHVVPLPQLGTEVMPSRDLLVYSHAGAYINASYLLDALNDSDAPLEVHGVSENYTRFTGASNFGRFLVMGVRL